MPYSIEYAECLRETDDASLIDSPDTGHEWFPKSEIDWDLSDITEAGDRGELVVTSEWARKQGWI